MSFTLGAVEGRWHCDLEEQCERWRKSIHVYFFKPLGFYGTKVSFFDRKKILKNTVGSNDFGLFSQLYCVNVVVGWQ